MHLTSQPAGNGEKKGDELTKIRKERAGRCWWEGPTEALAVFSPGKKPFSFGHSSVEALIDRFHSRRAITRNNPNPNPNPNPSTAELLEAHRNLNIRDLNMQLTNILNQLEIEKKRGDELTEMMNERAGKCWWEGPTEVFKIRQLEQVKMALEKISKNVVKQKEKMWLEGQGPNGGPYFMGAGPAGGGQTRVAFHPQVLQTAQAGVPFPPHAPPQDPNASELGLSLTPHGYAMGYGPGGHFG